MLTWGIKVWSVQLLPVGPEIQPAAKGATPGEQGGRENLDRAIAQNSTTGMERSFGAG